MLEVVRHAELCCAEVGDGGVVRDEDGALLRGVVTPPKANL